VAIEKHTVNEQTGAAIYGETANLNYFLDAALTPDTVGGVEERQKSYPQRSVRRYVGDNSPYTVGAVATVRYLFDPGRRNGSATPGKQMILDDGTERRQFTYTGSFIDIHAYFTGNAGVDLSLYSEGARYLITAVDDQQVPLTGAKSR
jgi:hypothetical protein